MSSLDVRLRFPPDDELISRLHALAFDGDVSQVQPWAERLALHSLTWVGAFDQNSLVGFVHVVWDGGVHGFLLDTAVDPSRQGEGVGTTVVDAAVADARRAGCEWGCTWTTCRTWNASTATLVDLARLLRAYCVSEPVSGRALVAPDLRHVRALLPRPQAVESRASRARCPRHDRAVLENGPREQCVARFSPSRGSAQEAKEAHERSGTR